MSIITMKKLKSQIFLFDLLFSFIILVVSISIIFSYYNSTTDNVDIYSFNLKIINSLTKTSINSLNDDEIRKMFIDKKIRNIKNSVAQQISDFYYVGKLDDAKNLTRIFIKDYVTKNINLNLTLINESGGEFNLYYVQNTNKKISDASILSENNRVVIGFINNTNYYGPYIFKVKIWV